MGIDFVVSCRAMKRVEHWPSAKRSRRLQKKMTKLRGPQYTEEPAVYRMADGRMIIHPKIYAQLKEPKS
jgi:hypothetical protein